MLTDEASAATQTSSARLIIFPEAPARIPDETAVAGPGVVPAVEDPNYWTELPGRRHSTLKRAARVDAHQVRPELLRRRQVA